MIEQILLKVKAWVKKEGYSIVETVLTDYDKTVKLIIKKDNEMFTLPVSECFYDTDDTGEITKFHGVLKIEESEAFKREMRDAV